MLTGLSGYGKTKLAQKFAKWISASDNQICIVPVGADWTNREPLLGYPNALEPGNYVLPESGALSLTLEAIENPDLPFFLILDEMNLSHVERYFADFLSTMESGEKIHLHPASSEWNSKVPPKITLHQNLFIVGTVNVDETSYMFSPKVLDRASVIEFRVAAADMLSFLNLRHSSSSTDVSGDGSNMARDFLSIANKNLTVNADEKKIHDILITLFGTLQQAGVEFGYRSAKEMLRFAAIVQKHVDTWEYEHIIDYIILQKLLPRIQKTNRTRPPLTSKTMNGWG